MTKIKISIYNSKVKTLKTQTTIGIIYIKPKYGMMILYG